MPPRAAIRHCAIYTRKSSEEGLDQDFNSLDAQREAGAAFVTSQAREGWRLVKTCYDDGGYSGGNLNRPGLARLLEDICAGRIHIVVVYKVDRLTRSLRDFAKLVEEFEAYDVSFVSVTQQFNTTTSMGRLMLNVLLSFAQFEREVTGERIRDKIAASKKKGMWMGGVPPLGYGTQGRALVVRRGEADLVREIFSRYLELGSISTLARDLGARGVKTRRYTSSSGKSFGNRTFSRGHLHRILTNPVYIGQVVHQGASYPGEHQAIVDETLWRRVQETTAGNRSGQARDSRFALPSLLKGLLFDDAGNAMSPSHATKGGRRYLYYVSQALVKGLAEEVGSIGRLPASQIDVLVWAAVRKHLLRSQETRAVSERLAIAPNIEQHPELRRVVERVVVSTDRVRITLAPFESRDDDRAACTHAEYTEEAMIDVSFRLVQRGGECRILAVGGSVLRESPNPALVRALVRSHAWHEDLVAGNVKSVSEVASREGVTPRYVRRILRFAFLAPDIAEAILEGTQPAGFTVDSLCDPIPLDWTDQRRVFGFAPPSP